MTSSPRFCEGDSTIICRSMLWGHLNVSLVEFGSLQAPLFSRPFRPLQGSSGKLRRPCLKICPVRLDRHEFIFRLSDSYTRCSDIM